MSGMETTRWSLRWLLALQNVTLPLVTSQSRAFHNSLYPLQHTEKWIKPKKQRKEMSETFDITIETQINVRKHWWSGFFTFWQTSHRFSSLIPVSWICIFKLLLNISKDSPVSTAHGTICLNSPPAHHSRTQALLEWSHTSLFCKSFVFQLLVTLKQFKKKKKNYILLCTSWVWAHECKHACKGFGTFPCGEARTLITPLPMFSAL